MLRQVASALRKSTPSVAPRAVFVPLGLRCYSKGAPFRPRFGSLAGTRRRSHASQRRAPAGGSVLRRPLTSRGG
jgi:hypothetical protein